mmetsp:Transcript_21271/g.46158  ORF Transcript_21271/g.46158 Transcript_21271/m.46158 type:complete len:104 (+) Transcript_21271:29-340(+)
MQNYIHLSKESHVIMGGPSSIITWSFIYVPNKYKMLPSVAILNMWFSSYTHPTVSAGIFYTSWCILRRSTQTGQVSKNVFTCESGTLAYKSSIRPLTASFPRR